MRTSLGYHRQIRPLSPLLAVQAAEEEPLCVGALYVDAVAAEDREAALLDGRDPGVLPVLVAGRGEAAGREGIQRNVAGSIQPVEALAGKRALRC